MPISVALQSATDGAAIHFTLDGSTPTQASPLYERPLRIAGPMTLSAIAVKSGMTDSAVTSGSYEFVRRGVTIVGTVLFDHASVRVQTPVAADLWFRDEETGQALSGTVSYYDPGTGGYAVTSLPSGRVGIQTTFQTSGSSFALPGNYYGWDVLDLTRADPSRDQRVDLRVARTIHLVTPFDNSQQAVMYQYAEHSAPVPLAWEAIPAARSYRVSVTPWLDPPQPGGQTSRSILDIRGLHETHVALDLPPSRPGAHYSASLYAYNDRDDLVGLLMISYTSGHGWSYDFKVI